MSTTLQYCTLFNSSYLARGLALYESLSNVCKDFHLYVFAFDDATLEYFRKHPEGNLTVISLKEFEDDKLLSVKSSRTAGEYCWTCTPSTILYCIEKFGLNHCTYIDADMFFYSDPAVLNNELKNNSVLITEHRYSRAYDQSKTSGIYCVQYVVFRNTDEGLRVLKWWRDACLAWCYNRLEDGKFGDQKYLDDWTKRFTGVHVMGHHGGGIAPWNIQQYKLFRKDELWMVDHKESGIQVPLVFFHFHGLRFGTGDTVEYTGAGYSVGRSWKENIFRPYAQKLFAIGDQIRESCPALAAPNGSVVLVESSHRSNRMRIFQENVLNFLRYILGRRASYRKMENHIYHRSELS